MDRINGLPWSESVLKDGEIPFHLWTHFFGIILWVSSPTDDLSENPSITGLP